MSDVKVWNKDNLTKNTAYRHFPTDMMMRALFSDRYFGATNLKQGGSVLDIGALYTNNLVPFHDRGWACFGTEVTEESVQIARKSANNQALECDIRLGFNTQLPFEDQMFDILLSIATIHYEEDLNAVGRALEEFHRVLKKGGSALIQTAAPKHDMFTHATPLGDCIYQLDMPHDLRHNQQFVFFEDVQILQNMAQKLYSHVEFARCTESYPNACVDVWLLKLVK